MVDWIQVPGRGTPSNFSGAFPSLSSWWHVGGLFGGVEWFEWQLGGENSFLGPCKIRVLELWALNVARQIWGDQHEELDG